VHGVWKSSERRVITRPDPHLKSKDRGLSFEVSLLHCTTLKALDVDHLVICRELRKVFMLRRTAETLRGSTEGGPLIVLMEPLVSGPCPCDECLVGDATPWSIISVIRSSKMSTILALCLGSWTMHLLTIPEQKRREEKSYRIQIYGCRICLIGEERADSVQQSKEYNAVGWSNLQLHMAESSSRVCSGVASCLSGQVTRQRLSDTPSSLGTRFTWGDSLARSAWPKRCREGVSNFFMQNDTYSSVQGLSAIKYCPEDDRNSEEKIR
jgi:hypothetical protein